MRDAMGWRAVHRPQDAGHLAALSAAIETPADGPAFEAHLLAQLAQFSAADGALFKMVCLRHPAGGASLLILAADLLFDGLAWKAFLQDTRRVLDSVRDAHAPLAPAQGVRYRRWSAGLGAQRQAMAAAPLPGPVIDLSCALSASQHALLGGEHEQAFRASGYEMLLAAAASAYRSWSGQAPASVTAITDGRAALAPGVNLQHTAACFTTCFPVALPVLAANDLAGAIGAVKDACRAAARQAHGGAMAGVQGVQEAAFSLRLDEVDLAPDGVVRCAAGHAGPMGSLDITVGTHGGSSALVIRACAARHQIAALDRLAALILAALDQTAALCREQEARRSLREAHAAVFAASAEALDGHGIEI